MARLARLFTILIAVAALAGCRQSLAVKDLIVKAVETAEHPPEWHGVKTIIGKDVSAAKVCCNGDNVYVAYYDNGKLMLIKSSDRGATWGTPYTVDGSTSSGRHISVAVDGANIYIVYQTYSSNYEDYFVQVTDGGSTFSTLNPQKISTLGSNGGYESSIAYDALNIYVAYSVNGSPAYTYAAKGSTITFGIPQYIDSSLPPAGTGTLMPLSILKDSYSGNIIATYFDNYNSPHALKFVYFSPTAYPLSATIESPPPSSPITSAAAPCLAACTLGQKHLISFYDPSAKNYKLYEFNTYAHGSLEDVATIDASSLNVGISGVTMYNGNLYTAYYDATNSNLKFAIGTQSDPSVDYAFTSKAIASAGSGDTDFSCSFVSDQNTNFYVVFYDSAATALKIAKSIDTGATW